MLFFENYSLSSSTLSSKKRRFLKNVQKNKCVGYNEVIWLMTMKMRLKMKNRSYRSDISRAKPRHRHRYTRYNMYLSIMMVTCIKQHLSNIWGSIHEATLRLSWKKVLLIKKACIWQCPECVYLIFNSS